MTFYAIKQVQNKIVAFDFLVDANAIKIIGTALKIPMCPAAFLLLGICLSPCHMDEIKIKDQRNKCEKLHFFLCAPTLCSFFSPFRYIKNILPSQFLIYSKQSLCFSLTFLSIFQPRRSTLLPSPTIPQPHSFIPPSFILWDRQKSKLFPWLTCDSPWPQQHPKSQTVRVRVGYSPGSMVVHKAYGSLSKMSVPQGLLSGSVCFAPALIGSHKLQICTQQCG